MPRETPRPIPNWYAVVFFATILLLAALLPGPARAQKARSSTRPDTTGADSTAAAKHAVRLPAVRVRADETRATGYVAHRSMAGTKTDTPLHETPQSISVVTRRQLDDQRPQSLNQAVRYTAGVVPETEGPSSNFWSGSSLVLRGFTAEVYQDGLEDDGAGNDLLDPYFYQSVAVVSGPASVLYGQGSPGGIVDVQIKRPTEDPIREFRLGAGSYDRYEGALDLGGPIDHGHHLLYRLTGVGFSSNTQTRYVKQQRVAVAPALTWQPNAATSLTLNANYTSNPAIGTYTALPALGTALPDSHGQVPTSFYVGDPNYNRTTQHSLQLGYQLRRRLGEAWLFAQDLRYTNNDNDNDMIWPLALEADQATLDRYSWRRQLTVYSLLIDNRLQRTITTGAVRQTLLAGVNFSNWYENWHWGANYTIPSIDMFAPVYGQAIPAAVVSSYARERADQFGLYAQDQIAIDRWRFVLGGRRDRVNVNVASDGVSERQPDHDFTGRAGVVYLFDNGLAPYAIYSTSFAPDVGTTASGAALPPTTGEQYEGGVKYQRPGSNNAFTAAVYNLTRQNVPTTDPGNPNFAIAIGEVRTRGVELQDQASLSDHLNLTISYTYMRATNTVSNDSAMAIDGTSVSLRDKAPTAIPRHMGNLWANYTLPAGFARGLGLGAGARYVGSAWGDAANSFQVSGFTLVDAALQYDLGAASPAFAGLGVQLNVSNLLDRWYVASCATATSCYLGMRRTIQATIRKTW